MPKKAATTQLRKQARKSSVRSSSLESALKLYEQGKVPKRIPHEPKPKHTHDWYMWRDIKNSIIRNRLLARTPKKANESLIAFSKRINVMYDKKKER